MSHDDDLHTMNEARQRRVRITAWVVIIALILGGGGATVFALVGDVEQGERIRRDLPGDLWSRVTWTLPDGVMAAHGFLEP